MSASHPIPRPGLQHNQNVEIDTNNISRKEPGRVEPIPKPDFPHRKYPRWIGHKFMPDGSILPFPGNTIICHLDPRSSLYGALLSLYDELKRQEFGRLFFLLPPTSWHMTVFEGVSDQIRKPSSWPGEVALEAPLNVCTKWTEERLKGFDLGSESPFQLRTDGWEPLEDGIALKVVPSTVEEERRLRCLRDRLSEHLQMRHPGHVSYSFHVSLAYTLRLLNKQDHARTSEFLESFRPRLPAEFELGPPEFCTFDNMLAFASHFHLKTKAE